MRMSIMMRMRVVSNMMDPEIIITLLSMARSELFAITAPSPNIVFILSAAVGVKHKSD